MKTSEFTPKNLSDIAKPSALVSLLWANRDETELNGIEKFKNLAELDISGNYLSSEVTQLLSLKYLKKLILSNNHIEALWPLPATIENLNISDNLLVTIQPSILLLTRLHTLDIGHNNLVSLRSLSNLTNLKCLYAAYNKIENLQGLERLNYLIELEVEGNLITKKSDVDCLNINSSISVVNLRHNPLQSELKARDAFCTSSDFPANFTELQEGVYYRNPEKLKEIKSSRYRTLIKKHKESERISISPDWGYSRRSSKHGGSSRFSGREVYDEIICEEPCEFVDKHHTESRVSLSNPACENEMDLKEITLSDFLDAAREVRDEEIETPVKKLSLPIAKLQLDKIDKPSYEKWTTKPNNNIEPLFDELISYCQLYDDINKEEEEGFGHEKYEYAVNMLKMREDERKDLILQVKRLNMRINDLESFVFRASAKDEAYKVLYKESEKYKKLCDDQKKIIKELESDLEFYKQQVLEMEQELVDEKSKQNSEPSKDIRVLSDQLYQLSILNKKLQEEKDSLVSQMLENENGLMGKIRELEQKSKSSKKVKFNLSFDKMSNRSAFAQMNDLNEMSCPNLKDMSYKQKIENGDVLVNREVAEYIKKLLEKISTFKDKLKKVRSQRDKLMAFYDKHKGPI
ncbi:unnamed protein product [Blepharisma stoltei]|uniref:Uncharacterized protein n=1 Tax=Blepharisma stoltei TaxID=1481888 RepID=A0AAU9JAH2_9CILI|nr:unnamed protein product [Blepharisma stoltei]